MTNNLLASNVEALRKQLEWLNRSYVKCRKIGIKKVYSASEFDKFETLSSRFARSIDFLVRRVFRSLDDVEFESQGTLVDVVNNAHKRGLFESMEEIGEMRDLRNDIVHEYLDEDLSESFAELLELTPKLVKVIDKTIVYSAGICVEILLRRFHGSGSGFKVKSGSEFSVKKCSALGAVQGCHLKSIFIQFGNQNSWPEPRTLNLFPLACNHRPC